jgi:hypothetical protein
MAKLLFREMAGWTRAIVRLEGGKRMVTEGYQKGVYEWVTKGIEGGNQQLDHVRLDRPRILDASANVLWGSTVRQCTLSGAKLCS